ncbi:uncharacterized protein PFLUO_LOCUS3836 [Penicillium psychrofluorescens]|uniref:uncharacterized protein n=1 Tax=Penicillium psychrofluorescens TaxID=3158075 RepID=UPI003CCD8D0B
MPSLRTLLLSTILSLAATTAAKCPEGWGGGTDGSPCCPGSLNSDGAFKYCCVAGQVSMPPVLPSGVAMAKNKRSENCAAKVPLTASDYSSLVSSASAMAAATTTGPSSNEASPTSSGSASPTTNAAMPGAMAEGMVLSGAAAAAALFML